MKQLPVLLEPWRPWLSLFPDDLSEPLGGLLLRLHPQIGPLRSTPARADALPEGVGSIVQRGPYERLLISEWAYADAEPDEFIRRAASGELMFAGPEPAARRRSRRCLVLFDAGPLQLGEPRLLHLALFILLARRAQEAGAVFEWGIAQCPGVVHDDCGRNGITALLQARGLDAVNATHLAAWDALIDKTGDDAWVIGAHGLQAPAAVRGQVAIKRQLLAEKLDVVVRMHLASRTVALDLPKPDLAIRLLRTPFEALAAPMPVVQKNGRPSLLRAPCFAFASSMLAVSQLDGSIVVYPVPTSFKSRPGAERRHAAPQKGSVLGAGIFGKSLGYLVSDGDTLRFKGFPGESFASKYAVVTRPEPEQFRAPPQGGRWLAVHFLKRESQANRTAPRVHHHDVFALDLDRNLVGWSRSSTQQNGTATLSPIDCATIARDVIGTSQTERHLLYAAADDKGTHIYRRTVGDARVASLPYKGSEVWFGATAAGWAHTPRGLLALRCSETEWQVGIVDSMARIVVHDGDKVIGVAHSNKANGPGLVVLTAKKRIIELHCTGSVRVLVRSPEDIAQASVCPRSGNIAWIGARSHRLSVQGIDQDRPYLEVVGEKTDDE